MDLSFNAAAAASTALSLSTVQEQLAIVALRAAEKEQTSILELFSGVAPPQSGRGLVVNLLV